MVLGEELGLQLFHPKWETRHGAVLGLQAIIKALRVVIPVDYCLPIKTWSKVR